MTALPPPAKTTSLTVSVLELLEELLQLSWLPAKAAAAAVVLILVRGLCGGIDG